MFTLTIYLQYIFIYTNYEHVICIRNLAIILELPQSLFKPTICLKIYNIIYI